MTTQAYCRGLCPLHLRTLAAAVQRLHHAWPIVNCHAYRRKLVTLFSIVADSRLDLACYLITRSQCQAIATQYVLLSMLFIQHSHRIGGDLETFAPFSKEDVIYDDRCQRQNFRRLENFSTASNSRGMDGTGG